MKKAKMTVLIAAAVMLVSTASATADVRAGQQRLTLSLDPYRNVQWDQTLRCKANLHTHTTISDGYWNPQQVVDLYHQEGYQILAITDHDSITGRTSWPWQEFDRIPPSAKSQTNLLNGKLADQPGDGPGNLDYENRNPSALGMIAIQGNEMSRHLHANSLFSDWHSASTNLDEQLSGVARRGGLAVMNHPAYHWTKKTPLPAELPESTVQNYISLYTRHTSLVAIEVINSYELLLANPSHLLYDRQLWDRILDALMPGRPVWGLAADDMHRKKHFGGGWVVFLLPSLDEASVRRAFIEGAFYSCGLTRPPAAAGASDLVPKIESITHDAAAGRITLRASINGKPVSEDSCIWIGQGGKTVHTGLCINYRTVPGIRNYVRAEISGPAGTSFTNPFGFITTEP